MTTQIDTYNGVRYATPAEESIFYAVENKLHDVSDLFFETIIEACSNHAFFGGDKKTYSRVYRLAKKLNVSPADLMLWYYMLD